MKFVIGFLALVALAKAAQLPSNTAYGYLVNYGIPAAERIREAEERQSPQNRIIGGVPAGTEQYPWQAGLLIDLVGQNGSALCGASLLNVQRLVTAAHCWFDGRNTAWRYTVVLGSVKLFSGGTRVQTSAVVVHPSWNPLLVRNDVAVIYLPAPVELSSAIAPIALPSGPQLDQDFSGSRAIVTGFGITENSGSVSGDLNQVRVRVISNLACGWAFPLILQPSNLCTSGVGTVGACSGDSGGPLVADTDNGTVLIGIVSFGSGLGCELSLPSVFTRVTSFVDFLYEHLVTKTTEQPQTSTTTTEQPRTSTTTTTPTPQPQTSTTTTPQPQT